MLVGERPQALREKPQRLDAHRKLALVRAEKRAFGGDDVAQIKGLEERIGFGADVVGAHEVLHAAREVAHGGKACLAHDALEHHAAGDGHFGRGGFQFLAALVAPLLAQVAEEILADEVIGVGDARLAHVRELGATLGDDVVFIFGGSRGRLVLRNCFFAHDRKDFKKNIGECRGISTDLRGLRRPS